MIRSADMPPDQKSNGKSERAAAEADRVMRFVRHKGTHNYPNCQGNREKRKEKAGESFGRLPDI